MADDAGTMTQAADAPAAGGAAKVVEELMTPKRSVLQRMQELPAAVKTYLLSGDLAAVHKRIFDEYGLSEDDRDVLYYTELQAFFGETSLADFPDKAWGRLSWGDDQEEKAASLVNDILGFAFLPAQAFLGDVSGLISELGGDLKKYPEKQIELRCVAFADGAREIAETSPLSDLDSDMRKRLAHIIESRLRQVRDDSDTKEMLMKAKKTGGMELPEADADAVVSLLASKMRMTKFVEIVGETEAAPDADGAEAPLAPVKELSPIEIKKVYSGTPEEQEALKKRMARFVQVTENDAAKMRDAYYQVLFPPDLRPTDPLYVVAGLVAMAGDDRFSEAVESDERYRNILRDYLQDKGREEDIAAYQEGPIEPRFMNMLLQLLLRGLARYDDRESARFALRYLNALKKQGFDRYADFVAFDMDRGAFRWKDTIDL